MILLSHPTGNQSVRNTLTAFCEERLLDSFWTTINWSGNNPVSRLFPSLDAELRRRAFPDCASGLIHQKPMTEIGRLISAKLNLSWLLRHEKGIFSIDKVYDSFDLYVARRLAERRSVSSVYAYEDGAAHTFKAAKNAGLKCVLEMPIIYWREGKKILDEEALANPEWAGALAENFYSGSKAEKKESELSMADVIVVNSSFTKESLKTSGLKAPVITAPLGGPKPAAKISREKKGPRLKALFVGTLLQRKGISYLFEALEGLSNLAELTLIGPKGCAKCAALDKALKKHRWLGAKPHSAVLEEMSKHDVLVLPSLFEGFGLVILEAMSRGLPVITTVNTAGADIIQDGIDGFLVPIRSSSAIRAKLELSAEDNELARHMSRAALEKAAAHSWDNYRRNLLARLKDTGNLWLR